MIHRFDHYALDTESLELRRGDELVPVEPQVFSVLVYLIANRDRVVSKDELIEAIWDGRAISDGALNSRINFARRAVGDSGTAQAIIKTFSRRGFRFVGKISGDTTPEIKPATLASLPDKLSVAVLPFDNLSNDPEQEYFSDGITEDLITALSRIRQFRVVARNSTFFYKGRSIDVRQVAHQLDAQYVIEGSIRKADNRIRLSVQLIDGRSGKHVWAERYDRELDNIFALQDEITETLVGAIQPEMSRSEMERARAKHPADLDAWNLYQQGMFYQNRYQKGDAKLAIDLFRQSINLNPNIASVHAGLALSLVRLSREAMTFDRLGEAIRSGHAAINLDSDDPTGYYGLADALVLHAGTTDGNFEEAISTAQRGLWLNPTSVVGHSTLAGALFNAGRAAEAIDHLKTAIRLSPRDLDMGRLMAVLSLAFFTIGDYEATVDWSNKTRQTRTVLVWAAFSARVAALANLGRIAEARAELDNLLEVYPMILDTLKKWHGAPRDDLIEGLRKAGLTE